METCHLPGEFEFLVSKGFGVNKILNDQGDTLLHWHAFYRESESLVIHIIRNGGDVNARNKRGETPLHLAARYGGLGIVRLLVEHGSDPRALTNTGKTPLDYAIIGGTPNRPVVGYLTPLTQKVNRLHGRL